MFDVALILRRVLRFFGALALGLPVVVSTTSVHRELQHFDGTGIESHARVLGGSRAIPPTRVGPSGSVAGVACRRLPHGLRSGRAIPHCPQPAALYCNAPVD